MFSFVFFILAEGKKTSSSDIDDLDEEDLLRRAIAMSLEEENQERREEELHHSAGTRVLRNQKCSVVCQLSGIEKHKSVDQTERDVTERLGKAVAMTMEQEEHRYGSGSLKREKQFRKKMDLNTIR